jgi:tetratricopeptide (TPR) repeat protein
MAKKHDKTEDGIVKVEEALSKTEKFIEQNQRILTIIIGGIIILVLGFFAVKRYYLVPMEDEAREQMFMAERYFELDSLDLALNGDGMYPGFLEIIDDYGITRSASLANYYAGIIYLRKGEFDRAIDHLEDYKGKDQLIAPMARGLIGDAYMELGRTEKAASYYEEAARLQDNSFSAPMLYFKAGMAYELLGKHQQAIKMYQVIKDEYAGSSEAREIDKYIARARENAGN